jgi:hypothetical protein
MPLPSTRIPISTQTLTATTSSVTFSSIPQTYTDLVLVVKNSSGSGGVNNGLFVNGDSGANYSTTQLYGGGSTPATLRGGGATSTYAGIAGANSISIVNFMNYSNTTTYKTWFSRGSGPGNYITADVSAWRNSSPITSITIANGGNWTSGTTLTLYGIKAA